MTIELKDGTKQMTTWGDTKEYLLGIICKLYRQDIYEKVDKISLKRINKKLYN